MKRQVLLLSICLIVAFSPAAFAGFTGTELTTLNGKYGSSWDSNGGSPYDLWRVLSDAGYTALANDIQFDIKGGGTPSSNYHVYKNTFWQADGGYNSWFVAEVAGYAPNNRFGWYEKGRAGDVGNTSESTWVQLFSGPDTSGKTADFFNSDEIGFWINPDGVSGKYFFTNTYPNFGNLQALVFDLSGYSGFDNNEYLICWEDLRYYGCTDRDFQDMIIRLKATPTTPEPATLSLLGLGLIGFVAKIKKKGGEKNR